MQKFGYTIAIIVIFFSTASLASDNTARKDSCEFVKILTEQGGSSGIDKLKEMFSWNPDVAEKAGNAVGVIKGFTYLEGNAYLVADLSGLTEQHLIAISTKKNRVFYFLFTFEKFDGKLVLVNIDFQDKLKKIIEAGGQFLEKPRKINC